MAFASNNFQKVNVKVNVKVNANQQKILAYLKSNPYATYGGTFRNYWNCKKEHI